jgi:hypothetical protein
MNELGALLDRKPHSAAISDLEGSAARRRNMEIVDKTRRSPMASIPHMAMVLGWAGVVPFAGLAYLTTVSPPETASLAVQALVSYGEIILGFMGGVQWGLEMARSEDRMRNTAGYAFSVVPALIAFAASLASPRVALWLLAGGFTGLLFYDLRRIRQGLGPNWYAALRCQLSVAVVVCLLVTTLAAT